MTGVTQESMNPQPAAIEANGHMSFTVLWIVSTVVSLIDSLGTLRKLSNKRRTSIMEKVTLLFRLMSKMVRKWQN